MDRQEKRKNDGIENGNDDDLSENSDVEDKVSWVVPLTQLVCTAILIPDYINLHQSLALKCATWFLILIIKKTKNT